MGSACETSKSHANQAKYDPTLARQRGGRRNAGELGAWVGRACRPILHGVTAPLPHRGREHARIWRKVKVKGHAEAVLTAAAALG